jgi:hypothetical protein
MSPVAHALRQFERGEKSEDGTARAIAQDQARKRLIRRADLRCARSACRAALTVRREI